MAGLEFVLFKTALGPCALVWSKQGVVGFQLPERSEQATLERLSQRFPAAQPAKATGASARCVALITQLLAGKPSDLSKVKIDVASAPGFHQRVYQVVQQIPRGNTMSYGEVAALAGSPGASRAVGQAMAKNPVALIVPCHRVTAASGKLGGFTSYGGTATKQALLALEGVSLATPAKAPRSPASTIGSAPFDSALALRALSRSDPMLGKLIKRLGPYQLELGGARSVFEGLARAIVFQQLSGKAAATIYERLCASLRGEAAGKGTSAKQTGSAPHPAPTPEQVVAASEAAIASAGISGAKQRALRDLAERTLNKSLPTLRAMQRMSDAEIIEQLIAVRGIGPWSAQMFLMFQLGRPDVLPLGDYSVRKAFANVYGLPDVASEEQVAEHGARWAPYRSVASWYLWRSLE